MRIPLPPGGYFQSHHELYVPSLRRRRQLRQRSSFSGGTARSRKRLPSLLSYNSLGEPEAMVELTRIFPLQVDGGCILKVNLNDTQAGKTDKECGSNNKKDLAVQT